MDKVIASIKLLPKFSHQFGPEYLFFDDGTKQRINKISRYETNLNFIDKSLKYPCSNGKDIVTYRYDCAENNKRDTRCNYYYIVFNELKKINKFLKECPDFNEQIEKNRGRYFFDFVSPHYYSDSSDF